MPTQNVTGRPPLPPLPDAQAAEPVSDRATINYARRAGWSARPDRPEDQQTSNAPRPAANAQSTTLQATLRSYIGLTGSIITVSEEFVKVHLLPENEVGEEVRLVAGRACAALAEFADLAAGLLPAADQSVLSVLRGSMTVLAQRHAALPSGLTPIDAETRRLLLRGLSTAWNDAVKVFNTASQLPSQQLRQFADSFAIEDQQASAQPPRSRS